MRARILTMTLCIVCCLALPAFAHWSEEDGHKMHYPQLPDPTGWDVCLVHHYLADDFQCSETGPIEDIHFWISWRFGEVGILPPVNTWHISIWDDAGGVPGNMLWQFFQGTMAIAGPWQGEQGWTCPVDGLIAPNDHQEYWQVNIVDIIEPFFQEEGTHYWLVISIPNVEIGVPGWKTSVTSPPGTLWGNPAVWTTNIMAPAWQLINTGTTAIQLHDLAFVITGNNGPHEEREYGDAPEDDLAYPSLGTVGMFPTCVNVAVAPYVQHSNFGAYFGPTFDLEMEGNAGLCPTFSPASYDADECFQDGDAGLLIPEAFTIRNGIVVACPGFVGTPLGNICTNATWGGNVDIEVHNHMPNQTVGYVNVLVDWNQDGQWSGSSICPNGTAPEHVLVNFPIPNPYDGPLAALVPPNFLIGPNKGYVWARFSITETMVPLNWDGSGIFEDGETEDYLLFVIEEMTDEFDFGDAPEEAIAYPSLGVVGLFPTCVTSGPFGWVQHQASQVYFGPTVDMEPDGNAGFCPQFTPNLYDQDECFQDNDAGLIIPEPFTITGPAGSEVVTTCPNSRGTSLGYTCTNAVWGTNVDISVVNGSSMDLFVNVLMDWNQDGQWGGISTCSTGVLAPEHVLVDFPVPAGYSGPLSGLLPPSFVIGPNSGYVWTRFTIGETAVGADGWNGEGVFDLGETEDYLLLVEEEEEKPEYDLGDAPDSTNNFGLPMTAYVPTGVMANYPTVYNDGSGVGPYGPLHLQPRALAFLGAGVSLEQEADIGLDEDPTNNIDPPADVPDLDLLDDGVIFPLVLPHCQQATFDYVVTAVAAAPTTLYVNVWFDWTRDGDWDDTPVCPDNTAAPEWAVQNQVVTLPGPGQYTITTPQFVPFHPDDPEEELWMRITLSEQQWQPSAQPGYGGSGPSTGYEYGETEDYLFQPVEPRVKWSQPPHGEGEGFDAASDFWWNPTFLPGIKWIQNPITNMPGLHSHDYDLPPYGWVRVADDWQCQGGVVTDLHWWGNYELDTFGQERRGAGIDYFELSIYDDSAGLPYPLPLEPPVWTINVPFSDLNEVDTGLVNSEGCRIYYYTYELPVPFDQMAGRYYWFSPLAFAVDQLDFAYWRWQEANRSTGFLGHAPAANRTDTGPWSSVTWPAINSFSDMAFIITSREPQPDEVNKVVADDFISDGRPIEGLRWWGSYLDPLYMPEEPVEPYVIDGWFISFHHTVDSDCPPDLLNGDDPTVLGIYFAPADAVHYKNMGYRDCKDEPVYEYFVNFDRCCLICSEVDPRSGEEPAEEGVFNEQQGFGYWLDVQAVVGVTWDPTSIPCALIPTDHVPSPNTDDGHFWGWHTSPGPDDPCTPLMEACTGRIVDMLPYPPDCWDYGAWVKQPWECPVPPDPQPVNMAYELITHDPDPCPCPGDMNGDGIVNGQDIQPFVDCMLGNPTGIGVTCFCGDLNCSKTLDIGDVPLFVDLLLITPTCP